MTMEDVPFDEIKEFERWCRDHDWSLWATVGWNRLEGWSLSGIWDEDCWPRGRLYGDTFEILKRNVRTWAGY